MPPNVTAICLGKSTYARVGVIANTTPLEASWAGDSITLFSEAREWRMRVPSSRESADNVLFIEYKSGAKWYNGQVFILPPVRN